MIAVGKWVRRMVILASRRESTYLACKNGRGLTGWNCSCQLSIHRTYTLDRQISKVYYDNNETYTHPRRSKISSSIFNSAELPSSPIIRANSRLFNDNRLQDCFRGGARKGSSSVACACKGVAVDDGLLLLLSFASCHRRAAKMRCC